MKKNTKICKNNKALWLGSTKRVVKQLAISTCSFLTLPFMKQEDNAIFRYFRKVYFDKPDPLIFDGNELAYYNIINLVIDKKQLYKKNIVDIGCGSGSFYYCLKKIILSTILILELILHLVIQYFQKEIK